MMKKNFWAIGLLGIAMSITACGGGTSGTTTGTGGNSGSGGSGAMTPTVASSCASYCTKFPASCPTCSALPDVIKSCIGFCVAERDCRADSTIEDCIDYRCVQAVNQGGKSLATLSTGCQTATKAWFDCLATQTKICDSGMANLPGDCAAQATALSDCK